VYSAPLNRREFVALSVIGTCACCAVAAEAEEPASQPSKKPPASQPAKNAPPGSLDAGTIDQYAQDGVYDAFRQSHKVLIFRQQEKLYAASARCTHKGCTLKASGALALKCPCHGSEFDINGIPTGGPAKTPLFRYAIMLKDGKVIVNTKRQFRGKEWDKPDAFVQIKPEMKQETKPA